MEAADVRRLPGLDQKIIALTQVNADPCRWRTLRRKFLGFCIRSHSLSFIIGAVLRILSTNWPTQELRQSTKNSFSHRKPPQWFFPLSCHRLFRMQLFLDTYWPARISKIPAQVTEPACAIVQNFGFPIRSNRTTSVSLCRRCPPDHFEKDSGGMFVRRNG